MSTHTPVAHATTQATVPVSTPVNAWGLTNRIWMVAAVVLTALEIYVAATGQHEGLVVLGEGGVGFVPFMLAVLFSLVGGAVAGGFGAFVVNVMGGYGRHAARYAIGGLIGGIVAIPVLFLIFSNTAAVNSFWQVLIGLPLSGLVGGIWAGISAAKRR